MSNTAFNMADHPLAESAGQVADVSIIPKELFVRGQRSIIQVIRTGKTEGLTVAQVAEMTDISERAVWQHIENHAISTEALLPHSLRSLKDAGVILFRAKRAVLIPKEGVQQLLKLINTPASWAIYFQLWDNSERLAALELKLVDTQIERDLAVQRIEQLEAEKCELEVRLEAATHTLTLGGNRKKPQFEVKFHRHDATDIFKNPVITVERVRKPVQAMDARERKRFKLQHGTRTLVGAANILFKELTAKDVTNAVLRHRVTRLRAEVLAFQNALMPDEGSLFALNQSGPMDFFNDAGLVGSAFYEAN